MKAANLLGIATMAALVAWGCGGPKETPDESAGGKVADGSGNTAPQPVDGGNGPSPFPAGKGPSPVDPIQKPGEKGWAKTPVDARTLGEKVAAAVSGMKNTYGESYASVRTPEGDGSVRLVYRIQDNKLHRVDYVVPKAIPASGFLTADGSERRDLTADGQHKAKLGQPFPEAQFSKDQLVRRWPREFTRLMFAGLTDGKDPWVPLLTGLAEGKSGFTTTIEKKTKKFREQEVPYYRVYAKRADAAAKTLGACEMEIVIEARRNLPVTIRVVSEDKNGKPWELQWNGGWNFDQKFDPKLVTSLS